MKNTINMIIKHLVLITSLFILGSSDLLAQELKDLVALPRKVLDAEKNGKTELADSLAKLYINEYLFKIPKEDLFTKDNLSFMRQFIGRTEGKAFKLFLMQSEKVNVVLGPDVAQYALRSAISREYLSEIGKNKKNNVSLIKKILKSKFGTIGLEAFYGKQMIFYLDTKDWTNFGKYYLCYFEKALKRPEYDINNITWSLFENVSDPKVLSFACDVVMKYAIERWYQSDVNGYDTYANLLYKTGKTTEAIKWEEKAVQMKKGQPDEKTYTDALEKMKKGLPTWTTPVNN
jgi:hypothetical protein